VEALTTNTQKNRNLLVNRKKHRTAITNPIMVNEGNSGLFLFKEGSVYWLLLFFIHLHIRMSNIYIYIKTPQIGNTNATAHMVEHCVLNRDNLSPEDFYALCDIKAECGLEYTKYDIHKKINVDEFVKEICKPLDKKIFQREASAFKEETKNELFRDTLKKKVETSLYGQIRKQDRKDITRGKINAYHKKHYKRENIVICNEEYKIIENNLKIQKA
jgi:hypothetical protein